MLEFIVADLRIFEWEMVCDMAEHHKNGNDEEFEKSFQEYLRYHELVHKGIDMMRYRLDNWDWKYLANNGDLCDNDWVMFKEELEEAGCSREEYNKKWKGNLKED